MTQTVPLYAVLIVFVMAGAGYLLWWLARTLADSARRNMMLQESLVKNALAVAASTDALRAMIEALAPLEALPKLQEALARVGHAQLDAVETQQQQRRGNSAADRDVEGANREWEIQEMQRAGFSREEAMLRLNPANGSSVWDGNVFEGWR